MAFLQSRRVTSKEEEKEISFFSKALKRELYFSSKEEAYAFDDLCTPVGAAFATYSPAPICGCIAVSALNMRNYHVAMLQADDDVMDTLNGYGSREDLEGNLGNPAFEERTNKIKIE